MSGRITDNIGRSSGLVKAGGGGGKVLQVVSVTLQTAFSTTATSWTEVTGLTVAITPSATSSKILVMLAASGSSSGDFGFMGIYRDSTNLVDARGNRERGLSNLYYGGWSGNTRAVTANLLDSPSTTSEVVYKAMANATSGGTVWINAKNSDPNLSEGSGITPFSTITVMEIEG